MYTTFVGDNDEAQKLCGCYGYGSIWPCRLCNVTLSELQNPNIEGLRIRDSEEAINVLENAYDIYVKKVKGKALSVEEKGVLKWCQDRSINPVKLGVMYLEVPFEGFSHYEYFKPDLLHTMLGQLKKWVFVTVVVLAQISMKWKGVYKEKFSGA